MRLYSKSFLLLWIFWFFLETTVSDAWEKFFVFDFRIILVSFLEPVWSPFMHCWSIILTILFVNCWQEWVWQHLVLFALLCTLFFLRILRINPDVTRINSQLDWLLSWAEESVSDRALFGCFSCLSFKPNLFKDSYISIVMSSKWCIKDFFFKLLKG